MRNYNKIKFAGISILMGILAGLGSRGTYSYNPKEKSAGQEYIEMQEKRYEIWKGIVENISDEEWERAERNSQRKNKKNIEDKLNIEPALPDNLNLIEERENIQTRYASPNLKFKKEEKRDSRIYVGENLIKRFEEYENIFRRYSNPPKTIDKKEFMALLVSISQMESSLGYPYGENKDDKLLMGYGNPKDKKYWGAERQVMSASNTIKKALEKENLLYKKANGKEGKEKLKQILSIYNQGKINAKGEKYAKEVLNFYDKWKKEIRE
ncbi:MAG: hypothetical protein WC584_02795 [Candidatus Pacearchaeota archaeon]